MELQLQNLTKQYGIKTAVNHLNLNLPNGVYGLLGANGAGKTTLMRLLCGLQKPTSGTILLNGKSIASMGERYGNLLGYLPQQFLCYPNFTAEEFLQYMAAIKGMDEKTAGTRIRELLKDVGLEKERRHKTRTFSGGMRQRLGIAQAMLNNPRILILDEPTAGLDPRERVRFRNLVSSYSRERIVLLSTHIVSDVESLADKILLMQEGNILHFGKAEEITDSIRGWVWECQVPAKEAWRYEESLLVSSLKNTDDNQTILRIVAERAPVPGAYPVQPGLEDLYLYYFGREGQE
ncbi:MAG: ABC transporter ATP-binding protein [Eubacteriales bacterium]|nr:ABC transporter ATP-binding protein [Eubacteriales bacterium]